MTDEVVAMVVIHVDDIELAASKEIENVAIDSLIDRFPTKNLTELSWNMKSECKRGREKDALEISQTEFIRNVLDRLRVTKASLTPASPSLELRQVNEEDKLVDMPF